MDSAISGHGTCFDTASVRDKAKAGQRGLQSAESGTDHARLIELDIKG